MIKHLLTIATTLLFIQGSFLSQTSNLQFPTFADPPGPENVLVVYNLNSEVSESIMLHYMDVRDIPFETGYRGDVASGIYLYRIEVIGEGNIPRFSEMKKMIFVK